MPSRSQILDAWTAVCGLDPALNVQLVAAGTLAARSRRLYGAPEPPLRPEDRPYSELQELAPYRPPVLPYPLQPDSFVLLWGPRETFDEPLLGELLLLRYPPDHGLELLACDAAGQPVERRAIIVRELADGLGPYRSAGAPALLILGVPPLPIADNLRGLEGLAWVVARLYGPAGCPWDRRQTHQSLRGALLEEAHEVLEALDAADMAALSEELGDLLLAIVAQSEMARQAGHFALETVIEGIAAKLIRRHPHVFADLSVSGTGEVLHNWEQIKAQELAARGRSRRSALDGIPASLPALATAYELVKKARQAGFAWPNRERAWAKLEEELAELRAAISEEDREHTAEELGDLLFTLVEVARWLQIDPEIALRDANAKFRRRFTAVEQAVQSRGRVIRELALDELLQLWQAAKSA